ncbi:hypothetical protein EQH57_0048 [Dictyocoela roeselum]|nr:hypothetical protein EQH57_0048 [Dictyocoela roeselum]
MYLSIRCQNDISNSAGIHEAKKRKKKKKRKRERKRDRKKRQKKTVSSHRKVLTDLRMGICWSVGVSPRCGSLISVDGSPADFTRTPSSNLRHTFELSNALLLVRDQFSNIMGCDG